MRIPFSQIAVNYLRDFFWFMNPIALLFIATVVKD